MKRIALFAALALAGALVASAYRDADPPAQPVPAPGPHTVFYYQRATLFDALPVDSTDIVFLGNSLTNGCEWHELLQDPRVINRGISGDIAQGLIDRLHSITKGQPDKIFLMVGVNDISHDVAPDSVTRVVERLCDSIASQSPRTRLYLQSMLPINNAFGRYKAIWHKEQDIRDSNRLLHEMADRKGITWIDLYDDFADSDGNLRADLTDDGLHLLGPAYLIWRDRLLPYLQD